MTPTPPAAPPRSAGTGQPGWVSSADGEWLRIIDHRIGLRVVRFRGVHYVSASDGIARQQPTAIFCQSGSRTLPEAMQAAEVLGEALLTALDKLAESAPTAPR